MIRITRMQVWTSVPKSQGFREGEVLLGGTRSRWAGTQGTWVCLLEDTPREGWGYRVRRTGGRWAVVNRVRRRDRLRSRCERPPGTARASARLMLAGGNPSGMRGYLGSTYTEMGEAEGE